MVGFKYLFSSLSESGLMMGWNLEHQFDPNWILYGDFYFPSYLGEMIQFDRHIFQMGLNHQLVTVLPASFDAHSICASQKPERGWSDNRCRCHSMPTFPPQKNLQVYYRKFHQKNTKTIKSKKTSSLKSHPKTFRRTDETGPPFPSCPVSASKVKPNSKSSARDR